MAEDDDLPPGSIIVNSFQEQLYPLNINFFIFGWKIPQFVTIIGLHNLPYGLNWKSKLYILCFQNSLPTKCIKHCYQHCDEPDIVDVYFFNHHSKQMFKTIVQYYITIFNFNLKII